ncbi:hypothetical protein [Ruminococcus sp.]|uniref:hypothetical protein n=1 Tax=Ruminococcus sp. TaxID=41978 RepID=UPI00388FFD1D
MRVDILEAAGIISAVMIIGGVLFSAFSFYDDSKRQKEEIKKLNKENTVICYALLACLDGLEQLGANHSVPIARDKLSKHLNQAAHDDE